MTFTHLTYRFLLAFASLVLLTGCADDLLAIQDKEQDSVDTEPGVWVSLQLSTPRATRADGADDPSGEQKATGPTSGEWGDGAQKGKWNEYTIYDLTFLLFRDKDENKDDEGTRADDGSKTGLDSDGDTEIYFWKHFSGDDLKKILVNGPSDGTAPTDKESKYKFKIIGDELPKKDDFAIVIANYGESIETTLEQKAQAHTDGILRLSDITGLKKGKSWDEGNNAEIASDNTDFLMANAYNDQKDGVNRIWLQSTADQGSSSNPFNTTVYLQRAAARIDLLYDYTADYTGTQVQKDKDGNPAAIVYDCKAKDGDGNTVVTAKVDVTHIQPINVRKGDTYVLKHLENGICDYENPGNPSSGLPSQHVLDPTFYYKSGKDKDNKPEYGETDRRLFHDKDYDKLEFTTSLASILKPGNECTEESGFNGAAVITYAEENTMPNTITNPEDFATGLLLRAVYRPKYVYSGVDADGKPTGAGAQYSHTGTFWRYMPNLAEGQRGAFSMKMRAESPKENTDLTDAMALYFSSYDAAKTYSDKHPEDAATITEFPGGVCYYNVWIRHANAEGDSYDRPIPMEFGIVRNNLYRLSFTFSGPGTPTPDIREPYGIETRIFVRPWNLRKQDTILM